MAPWYKGAVWTGAFGLRWVSCSNNDAIYLWVNEANNANYRHLVIDDQPFGHENFNYVVMTYQHRCSESIHTKFESYFMWEHNAELGGTPSLGPFQFGGGGGNGPTLPGMSYMYGVLNYTNFALSDRDYFGFRNEWVKDERGMRTGFPGNYTSNTIYFSHQFNDVVMLRPECGYYRNWNNEAFDNGVHKGILIYGFDLTLRF
jgi:hypothetical protein